MTNSLKTSEFDAASIFAAIEKINHRLDRIEGVSASDIKPPHPSLDKLSIAEAIADSIFGSEFKEKACQFEPSKPCDHCSMCNSRGF
ncbi:MAG: hypothetical protein IPL32_02605 [Chloracidobacterium sp.]|nr:hypothetical protein [Chloracidobacterium sp.]